MARYVDIPLQHIHENMLERMRRETSQQYIVDLIQRIRAGIPGIALRTTFIVGFPGETEACFETLLDFIRETKFERLGVFTYSQEDGTRAGSMAGQIPDKVKQQRRELGHGRAARSRACRSPNRSSAARSRCWWKARPARSNCSSANVSSWEHGLIRDRDEHLLQLKGRYQSPAARPTRRTSTAASMCGDVAARRIRPGEGHRPHGLRSDRGTGVVQEPFQLTDGPAQGAGDSHRSLFQITLMQLLQAQQVHSPLLWPLS